MTSTVEAEAQRAIAPEVIALWAFGLIATSHFPCSSASCLTSARDQSEEREVLPLGGDTWMTAADGLIGSLAPSSPAPLAVVVATALSPLSPIGPVRPCIRTWNLLRLVGTWSRMALFIIGLAGAPWCSHPQQPVVSQKSSYVSYRLRSLCGLLPLRLPAPRWPGRSLRWRRDTAGRSLQSVRSCSEPGGRSHGGLTLRSAAAADTGCTTSSTGGTGLMLTTVSDQSAHAKEFLSLVKGDPVSLLDTGQFFTLSLTAGRPLHVRAAAAKISPLLSGPPYWPDQVVLGQPRWRISTAVGDTVEVSYEGKHGPAYRRHATFPPSA